MKAGTLISIYGGVCSGFGNCVGHGYWYWAIIWLIAAGILGKYLEARFSK